MFSDYQFDTLISLLDISKARQMPLAHNSICFMHEINFVLLCPISFHLQYKLSIRGSASMGLCYLSCKILCNFCIMPPTVEVGRYDVG